MSYSLSPAQVITLSASRFFVDPLIIKYYVYLSIALCSYYISHPAAAVPIYKKTVLVESL